MSRSPEYESAFQEAADTLRSLTTGFTDADLAVVNRIITAWRRRASPSQRMQEAADEHTRLMRESERLKKATRGAA